jgi:hypothetical protein
MDPIVQHPSLRLLDLEKAPRKKLKPRHKRYFLNQTAATSCCRSDNISLFEKLALACCDSGVVPRKEFFETYASARLIQDSFPQNVHRVADLAAGHGLLSWMLLAMDDYDNNSSSSSNNKPQRTAICVDRRIPPSAIAIARSMRHHFFPLHEEEDSSSSSTINIGEKGESSDDEALLYDRRWTYVQTDLNNVVVNDASTLLVSVHACGTLSDYLIDMAISATATTNKEGGGGAPLALVPCCHTYSARKGYQPHALFSETTTEEVRIKIETLQDKAIVPTAKANWNSKTNHKFRIMENVIDEVRLKTLRNAGYEKVRIANLPQEFTERNRLFLVQHKNSTASATATANDDCNNRSSSSSKNSRRNQVPTKQTIEKDASSSKRIWIGDDARRSIRRGSMPPIAAGTKTTEGKQSKPQDDENIASKRHPSFSVNLRDDPKSIKDCVSVSGRSNAIQRLRALLPNHFAPKLDVSMWLSAPPAPPPPQDSPTTTKSIKGSGSVLGASVPQHNTNVTLEALQEVLDDTVRSYRRTNTCNNKDKDKRYCCTISQMNEICVHPENGRVACIYKIEYSYESSTIEENGAPFPKKIAKELHKSFCDNVVCSIDGTEIR